MSNRLKICCLLTVVALAAGCGGNSKYIRKLDSPSISVRYDAICYLGQEKEKKAVPKLVELLSPKQPHQIRLAAIEALGFIKKKDAVDGLVKVLGDTDAELRRAACDALGQMDDPTAVKPLLGMLSQPDVNLVAIWALGEIGSDEAIPALNALLDDHDPYIRYNAFRALKKLKGSN